MFKSTLWEDDIHLESIFVDNSSFLAASSYADEDEESLQDMKRTKKNRQQRLNKKARAQDRQL